MSNTHDFESRAEGREVSGALCEPIVRALRERGFEPADLGSRWDELEAALASPTTGVSWETFRELAALLGSLYSDREIERFGDRFVMSSAGRSLSLLGRLLPDPSDFYRWIAGSARHRAITCIGQRVEERAPNHLRLELQMDPGFAPSREYFIARKGFLLAAARSQGWTPPRVSLRIEGDRAIYDVRMRKRYAPARWLRSLRGRRDREASEIRSTIEALQAQREVAQKHVDDLERRRAELRISEERFSRAFEAAPLVMVISNDADGRIREVNRSFIEATGYSREEAVGKKATELGIWRTADDREGVRAVREQTRGSMQGVEVRMQDRRGRLLVTLLSSESVSIGDDECTLWQALDITERKRAESELAQYREQLEELVEARTLELQRSREQLIQSERLASVGTLAAGIAHEINNPVGLIHMAAEYALLTKEENLDREEVTHRALETCLSEAQRCGEIVRSILCFASGGSADREVMDLREVVDRSHQLVRSYASSPGYHLVSRPPEEPVFVRCAAIEMQQVLVNVLRNAVECGRSDVSIEIRCAASDGVARIEVEDDGPGIAPADLGQLFDPFYSTRKEKGGTGLGLSVAHGIVVSHEGTIRAESELGRGTRITMELPLVEAPPLDRRVR